MPRNRMIKDKINGMAWDIHEKLIEFGTGVWGVVVRGEDDVEVYFDDDVVVETEVKTKIQELKKPNVAEVKVE
jgi:hypothetical protein